MTEIKAQSTEKLVEDIDMLTENTRVGGVDLGSGFEERLYRTRSLHAKREVQGVALERLLILE